MTRRKRKRALAVVLALAIVFVACSGDDDAVTEATAAPAPGDDDDGGDGEECIGEPRCVPPNQPDVNQDGVVNVGILSPGDAEEFVTPAREFASKNGWELMIQDQINPADAAEQARDMCQQGVDMVAIAAGELAEAVPVAQEDECEGTVWYVAGGAVIEQTPYFFQTSHDDFESQYATGVATGHVMDAQGITKAGFVTGTELDFATNAFNAWSAGIKSVVPDAETVATYTGDFDDASVAQDGTQTLLDQGVGIVYPYLRGATDAAADVANAADVKSISPGTDRCDDDRFAVSSIFGRGELFAAALQDFNAGMVKLGVTRMFKLGVDPVPTVEICESVDGAADLQAATEEVIAQIASGDIDPAAD